MGIFYHSSSKAIVCLCACFCANPSKIVDPNEVILNDDFPWGAHGFKLKNFRIGPTVRRKIEKMLTLLATILFITSFFISNSPF